MIGYLKGNIKFIFQDFCILDVNGIGFKIFLDANTLKILKCGMSLELFIHTAVSDNAITLYGFNDQDTFELFELLLTVSGIGAKSALNIVSKISPALFATAIANHDLNTLTKLPGVGKKSAERILLELKDKIKPLDNSPAQSSNFFDAQDALEALGYSAQEIQSALKDAPANSSTEQLIKFALKSWKNFE